MLVSLHVKNLVLIEEAEINFQNGLNLLTGETGAGKSIVIGSINYALGSKVDHDVIREGAEYALVELVFSVEREEQKKLIREMDLPMEEDGILILTRKIMPGKSILKVCGETVSAKQVKELASVLIDIHGQREHQTLLENKKCKALLDDFCGDELSSLKAEIADLHKEWMDGKKEQDALSMDDALRQREISLAEFEVREIEAANLNPGEDIELEKQFAKMKNYKKIADYAGHAEQYLLHDNGGIIDPLGYAIHELGQAAVLDDELNSVLEQLGDAESILRSASRDLRDYIEDSGFSEEDFLQIEERLDCINHLKSKYGATIERILAYADNRRSELNKLMDLDRYKEELVKKLEGLEKKMYGKADKAHAIRAEQAKGLSKQIEETLLDLNFLKVSFAIALEKKDECGIDGYDEVEFDISLNPGEKMRPLKEVASGGELSRIMLALKTVLARRDQIDTLIFDEIDTGISGKTAWKVAEKMAMLGKEHQVICITHLPQIAAMADAHFLIEKGEKENKTVTRIKSLEETDMIPEIARLLGSDNITEAVLKNAEELKALANQTKENIV